jgi:hypothetical protein
VLFALAISPLHSESPQDGHHEQELWVAYAEASARLAEVELEEAESLNRHAKDSVSEYDLERLRLHKAFALDTASKLRQGWDYGRLNAQYAELHSKLADLDLSMAQELRRKDPAAIPGEKLERLLRNAEVCKIQVALAHQPEGALSIIDHLHRETHRLAAEVLRLNCRIERLEELGQR